MTDRPLVLSLEVTLSCNCNCRHCDLGGIIRGERQLQPEDYTRITRLLSPPVVQISGGEPLLRKDIIAVVKAIKQSDGLPYLILVTNGVLLDESIYLQLHEAGLNQLSVSLDFPDARHDKFRRHRGLYEHLERTIPHLAEFGYGDIILNTAITRANLRDVLALGRKAENWNVAMSYSAYTALRTGDKSYCIDSAEDLNVLRQMIGELMEMKKQTRCITNSKSVFLDTLKFFEHGHMPKCQAGRRFFVVMPDGSFVPCSLHRNKYSTQEEMIKDFSHSNQCNDCYVSIRAYSDKSIWALLRDMPAYGEQLFARYT